MDKKRIHNNELEQSLSAIRRYCGDLSPDTGIILGSGLGPVAEGLEKTVIIPYHHIPGFPETTVVGHAGQLVIGHFGEKTVVAMQGRFHYYEGHPMTRLAFPVEVLAALGIRSLIVTSASGGVNRSFIPGDLMLLSGHLNVVRGNPLWGELGIHFANTSHRNPDVYSTRLRAVARKAAETLRLSVREGIYAFMTGPSFETPAEIEMIHRMGGDAVGMSTVPEALTAFALNIEVLGITYIANMGSGISDKPLEHEDVLAAMDQVKPRVIPLLREIIRTL
ncbi:MAG: purine-nucleoside phosphorylase [Bacteroidia bacterium]|nr:purine-nucleoside phosphorylase [Bacteroidia bacterium]